MRRALTQLYQQARTGKLAPPVVVVFGDDEFLVQRVIQRLVDFLLPTEERQTALTVLDGKDATDDAFTQALLEPKFGFQFLGRRVVVVKTPAFLKERGGKRRSESGWLRLLKQVPDGTFVLMALTEPPPPSALNALNEAALLVPISKLPPRLA